jgi:ankyrin repeat protein
MKKWSRDMLDAFNSNDEPAILSLIRLGYPPETPLILLDSDSSSIISKTFCAHLLCEYGFLYAFQELILSGCNIESLDSFARTPLMVACEAGHLPIVEYLTLTCKASIKPKDYAGNTLLHAASINGHVEIVKFLVGALGISHRSVNFQKKTPLALCREIYARDYNQDIAKVIVYLIMLQNQNEGYEKKSFDNYSLSIGNCHDNCVKSYKRVTFYSEAKKERQKSIGSVDETRFQKMNAVRKYKASFYMQNPITVEKMVSLKCDQIYRKILNESSLMPLSNTVKVYSRHNAMHSSHSRPILSLAKPLNTNKTA